MDEQGISKGARKLLVPSEFEDEQNQNRVNAKDPISKIEEK